MPTQIPSRALTTLARIKTDVAPFVVVILLSLLFATAFWSAFAPRPMPDAIVAAIPAAL